MQHPDEAKRPFATVPYLQLCIRDITVLRTRRLPAGKFDEWDRILQHVHTTGVPLYILFPGSNAQDVESIAQSPSHAQHLAVAKRCGGPQQLQPSAPELQSAQLDEATEAGFDCAYVLLIIDGTWSQAREMFVVRLF